MRRRVLLGAAALLGGAAAMPPRPPRAPLAATPLSRMDLPWWKRRFEEKQARLRQGHVDLVFYGDSITQDWEHDGPEPWNLFRPVWDRFYGDRNAVNLGYKGDTTAHLLWRIENGEASGISPKAAVILIGANNMGRVHWSAEDTLAGIDADIGAIRQRLPQTKILLLGVLPSQRSQWVDESTRAVNHGLAARYTGGAVAYLDVGAIFQANGQLDRTQFLDIHLTPPDPPLHPTAEAQTRMAEAMEPTLSRMLGDRSRTR